MPKVTLYPSEEVIEVRDDQNLLEALRDRGVYIKSSCGGVASCSDCIIKIRSGEDEVSPPPFEELALLGNVFHITKERLACQTYAQGDITIDISDHDKQKDQARLQSKTSSQHRKSNPAVKVRKKDDVRKIYDERRAKREEKDKASQNEDWVRHWEKNKENDGETGSVPRPKRLGGGQRPKPFTYTKDDDESND